MQTFDLGSFLGKNIFSNDVSQNYCVFQPMIKYVKTATIG